MGGYTNYTVEVPGASWGDVASHDTAENNNWRDAYIQAAEIARQSAFYQAAQAVVIAGIQAAAADHAADQQYEIADRQMKIAESEYDRYIEHFVCAEHKVADEACAAEKYAPDYDTRANRSTVDIRRQFTASRAKMARSRSRYCLGGFESRLCDLEAKEATAIAAAKDAGYRYEEARQQALDDKRWARMLESGNLGRGVMNNQSSMYNGAMSLAAESFATRLGGINNFLAAASGGLSGIITANAQYKMAQGMAPSPFTNSYASFVSPSPYMSGHGFSIGGPSPLGAYSSIGGMGGVY